MDPTSGSGPAEPARPAAGTAETAAPATPRPGAEPGGRSEARRAEDAIAEDPRPAPDAGHPAAGTEAEDAPAEDAPTEDTPAGPTSRAGSVASHAGEERWTPVTVPAPSYTLKPTAPRRDVAPFEPDVQPAGQVPHRPTTSTAPTAAAPAQPAAGQAVPQAPAPAQPAAGQVVPQAPALDLDAVLARRRAAGSERRFGAPATAGRAPRPGPSARADRALCGQPPEGFRAWPVRLVPAVPTVLDSSVLTEHGAMAQLVARLVRNEKVAGSNPARLHPTHKARTLANGIVGSGSGLVVVLNPVERVGVHFGVEEHLEGAVVLDAKARRLRRCRPW